MDVVAQPKLGFFPQVYADYRSHAEKLPSSLERAQALAWKRFESSGLPGIRVEAYKYTNLRSLGEHKFDVTPCVSDLAAIKDLPQDILALSSQRIVISHGQLATVQGLASGIEIKDFRTFAKSKESDLLPLVERYAGAFKDPFVDLNISFLGGGVCVDVGPGLSIREPLLIVHIQSQDAAPTLSNSFNVIRLAADAECDVIEVFISGDNAGFMNCGSAVVLGERAKLSLRQVQILGHSTHLITSRLVTVEQGAHFASVCFDAGAKIARHNLNVMLAETTASAKLDAVYLTEGKQHVDHHTFIDHQAPDTRSNQVYKGILKDHSRAVFNGKIIVRRDAQQTAAHQLSRNLLLGEHVEIDAKPELQIDANDIKCSHGATIGRLNDDELFYMMSRGIRKEEAERLLGAAYVRDVIDQEPHKNLANFMKRTLDGYFLVKGS